MRLYTKAEARHVWQLRESGPRAAAAAPGAPPEWEGWDDAAVAAGKIGRLSARHPQAARRIRLPRRRSTAILGTAAFTCASASICKAKTEFATIGNSSSAPPIIVVSYGGSLSGEHGDGQSRGALLPKMFGPELMKAFGEFKSAWDPGQQDESAQSGQRLSAHRKSAPGRGL